MKGEQLPISHDLFLVDWVGWQQFAEHLVMFYQDEILQFH